ncbi:hypothetical protein BWD162_004680 [Bartonella sp. WD16.2]|nr:hypothetical protein BWD162_004680 [Bartonella sp. WD16.2]
MKLSTSLFWSEFEMSNQNSSLQKGLNVPIYVLLFRF